MPVFFTFLWSINSQGRLQCTQSASAEHASRHSSLPMSRGRGKRNLNRPPSSRARTRTPVCSRVHVALSPRRDVIGHGDRATCSCLPIFKFQAGVDSRVKYEKFATARDWGRENRRPHPWDSRTQPCFGRRWYFLLSYGKQLRNKPYFLHPTGRVPSFPQGKACWQQRKR